MADKYVVAVGGVWANKVLPVELPLNIVPEKTLRVKVDRRVPIFFDAINNFYMRPEGGESNALLGDLDPGMASADPDSFNPLDRPGIDEAVRYMESAAKRLGWASNMATSMDGGAVSTM